VQRQLHFWLLCIGHSGLVHYRSPWGVHVRQRHRVVGGDVATGAGRRIPIDGGGGLISSGREEEEEEDAGSSD